MSDKLHQQLLQLLATLRAIKWHAWNLHWKASGPASYSDHLLFQRIYAGEGGGPEIDDQIDGLGERITALYGNSGIDGPRITEMAYRIHRAITGMTMVAGALELEQKALKLSSSIADRVAKGAPRLRVSLDNFVRELADARSTVVYLLKQRASAVASNYGNIDMTMTFTEMPSHHTALLFALVGGGLGVLIQGKSYTRPSELERMKVLKHITPKTGVAGGALLGYALGEMNAAAREEEEALEAEAQTNGVYSLAPEYGTLADAALFQDEDTKKKLMCAAAVLAGVFICKKKGII